MLLIRRKAAIEGASCFSLERGDKIEIGDTQGTVMYRPSAHAANQLQAGLLMFRSAIYIYIYISTCELLYE